MNLQLFSATTSVVKWMVGLIIIGGCLIIGYDAKTGPTHDRVVVCYVATWAVYRPGRGSFEIEHIDPNLCTHVVYAFTGLDITKNAMISLDSWQDLNDGKKGFERINSLKRTHPHLKVTLAIGGWNEGSKNYSILSSDPLRRQLFVKQATEFIRKHKFDGLDLDWEYPTQRGGELYDRENFVSLVKELRMEFNRYGLLLTSAIGASKNVIDVAYDVKELSKYLDYLHIMCYDYSGSWDKQIGPNAPLERGDDVLSVKFTMEYLISLGAPPSKLVMGVPFYGRTFKTMLQGNYGDISDEIGFQGPYTRENGFLGYNEICILLSNKTLTWTKHWDDQTSQAIAKLNDIDENGIGIRKVVVYDDTRSIARKMRFAVKHKLAGVMVWSVDTDDFLGDCESETNTFDDFHNIETGIKLFIPKRINANYPLLKTINEGLNLALEEDKQHNEIEQKEKENFIPHGTEEDTKKSESVKNQIQYLFVMFLLVTLKLL